MEAKIAQEVISLVQAAAREGVKEAIAEFPRCCSASQCKESCGITPPEHFEAHKRLSEHFKDIMDIKTIVRGLVVKAVAGIIITATIVGLGLSKVIHLGNSHP